MHRAGAADHLCGQPAHHEDLQTHGTRTPIAHLLQAPELHEVQPVVLQELVLSSAVPEAQAVEEAPCAERPRIAFTHKFDNPTCKQAGLQTDATGVVASIHCT